VPLGSQSLAILVRIEALKHVVISSTLVSDRQGAGLVVREEGKVARPVEYLSRRHPVTQGDDMQPEVVGARRELKELLALLAQSFEECGWVQHPRRAGRKHEVARARAAPRSPRRIRTKNTVQADVDLPGAVTPDRLRVGGMGRKETFQPPPRIGHVVVRGDQRYVVRLSGHDVRVVLLVRAVVRCSADLQPASHQSSQGGSRLLDKRRVVEPENEPPRPGGTPPDRLEGVVDRSCSPTEGSQRHDNWHVFTHHTSPTHSIHHDVHRNCQHTEHPRTQGANYFDQPFSETGHGTRLGSGSGVGFGTLRALR
jgi:hypothetical protein